MNKILAIVVTYNRKELLKECMEQLFHQSYADFDILVVDNHSEDGTDTFIETLMKQNTNLFYQKLDTNMGGAGGFYYGMKYAVENDYTYCWLMDDDCIAKENTLEEFIHADQIIPSYGYLSSVVLWNDGLECKMNRQKIKKKYNHVEWLQYGIIEVMQSSFVSVFVPVSNIKEVGYPIKEFFIWADDVEYTRRMTVHHNMSSYMVGKSQVIHRMKQNTGSDIASDEIERLGRYAYAYRNENYLFRKEGIKGMLYYYAKCGYHSYKVLRYAKDHKWKRLSIIWENVLKGIFFHPEIEYYKQ